MKYLLYLPKDYDQKGAWPLLLFLHGSGERGRWGRKPFDSKRNVVRPVFRLVPGGIMHYKLSILPNQFYKNPGRSRVLGPKSLGDDGGRGTQARPAASQKFNASFKVLR
jgi:hypothetical protein